MGCVMLDCIPEIVDLRMPELFISFEVEIYAGILDGRKSFANSFEYFITCSCDLINNGK